MRELDLTIVTKTVKELLLTSCTTLGNDIYNSLQRAEEKETNGLSKSILTKLIENVHIASSENVPLCQDTGIVICFLEVGSEVFFYDDINEAINQGVREAYCEGYFRKSVVADPIGRINTKDNTPAIIHTKIIPGNKVKITVAPKGAGSENMSAISMLVPADGKEGIKKFVCDVVKKAGGKPCPPIIVGIGIGGDFEKAALISKEALMRDIEDEAPNKEIAELEKEILKEINDTKIGVMGFGGDTTCLAVKINTFPCHIASLPVAVNIQCHCARHRTKTI